MSDENKKEKLQIVKETIKNNISKKKIIITIFFYILIYYYIAQPMIDIFPIRIHNKNL